MSARRAPAGQAPDVALHEARKAAKRTRYAAVAREIGVQAHLAGENAFTFGLLRERAHHQVLACERESRRAWRRARSRKSASWLGKADK